MPHMANLPWIPMYLSIGFFLTLFWTKENFTFSSNIENPKKIKMTHKALTWNW